MDVTPNIAPWFFGYWTSDLVQRQHRAWVNTISKSQRRSWRHTDRVRTLCRICRLGLATSIVTIERRKAEWMLFALLAASTTIAIFVWARPSIVVDLSRSPFANGILPWIPTVLAIGSIVAVATAIRAYERSETRTKGPSSLILRGAAQRLALGIAIFVLCATALIRVGQGYILAATAVALTIFAALALIRRLGFGVWGYWGNWNCADRCRICPIHPIRHRSLKQSAVGLC